MGTYMYLRQQFFMLLHIYETTVVEIIECKRELRIDTDCHCYIGWYNNPCAVYCHFVCNINCDWIWENHSNSHRN